MIQEFINEIESGLGFIFEDDVKKYWNQWRGDNIESEEQYQEILNELRAHNLLK